MTTINHLYVVTVVDSNRKRSRHLTFASCWYEAWKWAANTYGINRLLKVKPGREKQP